MGAGKQDKKSLCPKSYSARSKKTLVLKLGTGVLTRGAAKLDRAHMVEIVARCAAAVASGHRIILVSSGAIAAGREHLNFPDLPPSISSKQLLAAVGQSRLIRIWEQLFSIYGLNIGQMLLTRADIEDRERFLNARDLLNALLDHGIIPVVNENDAVAVAEIKVGDNDNLSALVAVLAEADLLFLLTDTDGLYTADPHVHPDAELVRHIDNIDDSVRSLAGESVSGLGTGGMATKIQAAEIAVRAGIGVVIASGARSSVIGDLLEGRKSGTCFAPHSNPLERRKLWIFGAPAAGGISIDAGAASAMLKGKSSLLPAGITAVSGSFARGAVVRILGPDGGELARGVPRYNSDALSLMMGRRSDDIAGILGYEYGPVAVHRNDLIMLQDSED
ncbi:MAG: glutamate 5-kinase [Desulfovibrio sp.]|jgi:glutamate 5-kinase|nr:glutamate 5-kinase [Desulfovibrio sp.]